MVAIKVTERLADSMNIRLTIAERVAIEQRAAREGTFPTRVARELILEGLRKRDRQDAAE